MGHLEYHGSNSIDKQGVKQHGYKVYDQQHGHCYNLKPVEGSWRIEYLGPGGGELEIRPDTLKLAVQAIEAHYRRTLGAPA